MTGPATEVAPRRAVPEARPSGKDPEREPAAPAIPNQLLQLMTGEDAAARALLWEWQRMVPPAPAPPGVTTTASTTTSPASGEAATTTGTVDSSAVGDETSEAPEPAIDQGAPKELAGKNVPAEATPAGGVSEPAGAVTAGEPRGAGTAPTVAPAGPLVEEAAGEVDLVGASGLEAWGQRVREATARRIRAPAPEDPAPVIAAISGRTARVGRRESARRARALSDVRGNLPPAPAIPAPKEPPKIPRPDVEERVAGAIGKKLPDQVLPLLVDYTHVPPTGKPQTFKPKVAGLRLPEGTSTTLTPIAPPKPTAREERRRAKAVRDATLQLAPVPAQGAFTLGTLAAPGQAGALPTPPVAKVDIAGVLARLRLSTTADAEKMLCEIRAQMYPRRALQEALPALGAELQPDLEARMAAAIDVIATQAGIDLAAVHGATVDATGKVVLGAVKTQGRVTAAEKDGKDCTNAEGKKSSDADTSAALGAEQLVDATLLSAQGGASPAEIRSQRDRLVARALRRLAPDDLRYEREGEDRLRALQLMATLYTGAYLEVTRQVAERVRRDAGPVATIKAPVAAAPPVVQTPAAPDAPAWSSKPIGTTVAAPVLMVTPAEQWGVDRLRDVRVAFTALRKEASDSTARQRAGIVEARDFAVRVLGEWAEKEVEGRESGWDRFRAHIDFWGKAARDRTQAWEEARSAQLGADLRGDIAFVSELASGARSQAEIEAVGALGGLSDAQKAIATAYFTGKEPRDPLGAIAVGMRMRITQVHRPRITEELDRQLYALPKERWHDVAVVAESEGGGIVIAARGDQFHASVDQWGTDEAKLYSALTGLTKLQRHALDLWYQQVHGSTIDKELRDELEDAELDRAQALMAGDQTAADAATIRDAIEGAGTDEEAIYRTLRIKDPQQRADLEAYYLKKYLVTLEADLKSDLNSEELSRANALREGNHRKADAIGLEMAKTGKWYGGVDTGAIADIYAQNRLEVQQEAVAGGWTSEQLHDATLARNKDIDREHRGIYTAVPGQAGEGLEASFKKDLRGPQLELALGLQTVNLAQADAALLEMEKIGFVTDDKVVTKILESQYDRAETEVRLDQEHRLAYRQDLAAVRGERWDDKAERKAMETGIRTEAAVRGKGYMADLKKAYNDRWQNDPMSRQHGYAGFDQLIERGLQGSDEDRAKALIEAGGRLNPAQEIKYAVQGPGTDVDVLKRMLEGKTKEEIREIEKQWKELYPNGPTLWKRIMEDVSGRDAVDLNEMLAAPETPRELLESAKRRQKFEAETFSLGATFGKAERTRLDADVARLEKLVEDYDAATDPARPDPNRAAFLRWRVDQEKKAVDSAIDEHRRNADSVTDTLAMVAAVVAGAVITAVTWGAAGPFVAAGLGALAAAEATILTKIAVKGAAYSEEELLVDVVTGVVDVILAVSTAGIGNALMRVKEGVPVGRLAKLATSASRAKRMVAHGLANGVEGVISGIPSGAAGALADEKTWSQGGVLTTVLTGTAMGAASGAVMGGLIGSAGGWKAAPIPLNLPPGSMPDAAARAAQWHVHSQKHPTASYADFTADLDAGRIKPDPQTAITFRRATQDALASGLPRSDRKLLSDVAVTVLSDAEFTRVTRSSKGNAVTIVENGKPRVVMRESAPLSALREEGIHVAQALDPELAGHFKLLDEALLVGWDQLPLGARLAAYAAKLDLEIDANARLLRGLAQEADALGPGVARKALMEQVAEIGESLGTLLSRRTELASFGIVDRLRARLGAGLLAARLLQPARLFNKAAAKAAKAAKKLASVPPAAAKKVPKKPAVPKAPKAPPSPTAPKAAKVGKAPKVAKAAPPNPSAWGAPPDPATASRTALGPGARSPQEGRKGVLSVKQVGDTWHDVSVRGRQRNAAADAYRMVEVQITDPKAPNGIRTKRFHETVVRGSNPPRWVKRGSHAAQAGDVAEEASLAMTRRYIAKMQRKGVRVVTLGSGLQNESGQGFDEVYFEFHPGGRVEVVLVEVKDYTGRRVPFGEFTAVTGDILKKNLSTLRDLVVLPRGRLPAALQSLDDSQLRALRKKVAGAVNAGAGLTLEVRLGATTGLGGQKQQRRQDAALRKLQRRFRSRPVRQERLSAAEVDLAARVTEVELPEASTSRLLDTHASLAGRGIVDPVIVPVAGQPGVFTGASDRATTFRAVTSADVGGGRQLDQAKLTSVADDTVTQLKRQLVPAPGKAPADLNVVLDLSGLDPDTRRRLMTAIDSALAATGQASTLRPRLHIEPIPRGPSRTRP